MKQPLSRMRRMPDPIPARRLLRRAWLVLAAVLVSSAFTLVLFGIAALLQRISMPWRHL